MADRSVSVPVTLSDLERPNVRNQFFQADLNNAVRSVTSLHLQKCVARFISDSSCITRATLCVSAVFAVARCPSSRPSVYHVGALYPHGWRYRTSIFFFSPVTPV